MSEEKKEVVVLLNKSNRRFMIGNDASKSKPVFIGPGATAEVPASKAAALLKTYPKALFDISKMAKPQSVKDIEKEVKDRDEKIKALSDKIAELEGVLKKAEAEAEEAKGLKEKLSKAEAEIKKLKK